MNPSASKVRRRVIPSRRAGNSKGQQALVLQTCRYEFEEHVEKVMVRRQGLRPAI
jgi:hypothetical protein